MKGISPLKTELVEKLEEFARKVNQTAQHMIIQDPPAFAEQVRQKGLELLGILKASLFKERARVRPEYYRTRVRKKVTENLADCYHSEELVDLVTNTLITAAKEDSSYRRILGIEDF